MAKGSWKSVNREEWRGRLTIKLAGIQNTQDHRAIVTTVKAALGTRAEPTQLTRLGRLVSRKDEIQYDHRQLRLAEASEYLDQVKRFASWAKDELGKS